jgi:hypothetical protein
MRTDPIAKGANGVPPITVKPTVKTRKNVPIVSVNNFLLIRPTSVSGRANLPLLAVSSESTT